MQCSGVCMNLTCLCEIMCRGCCDVLWPSGFSRVWDVQTENGGLPALHRGPAHAESGLYEPRGKPLHTHTRTHTHTHTRTYTHTAIVAWYRKCFRLSMFSKILYGRLPLNRGVSSGCYWYWCYYSLISSVLYGYSYLFLFNCFCFL